MNTAVPFSADNFWVSFATPLFAQSGSNLLVNAGIFVLLAAGAVYAVCRSSRRN